MIAFLIGRPIIQGKKLIVEVHGVGYEVMVSPSALVTLANQTEISLHIQTIIRPETFELYGFLQAETKEIFLLLQSVPGVGPRTALALSELGATRLTQAVQEADVPLFTQVPRVGKKLAQTIIIQLKSKLGSLHELQLSEVSDPQQQEVLEALISLGFDEQASRRLLPELEAGASTSQQLKQAIRLLTQGTHHD